ncbi:MAG TPA: TonB C-terminal domain-containing protein [Myxococcales bacterium]|nr:TonB C-terminal domain-containing protein [Myxococcales bacterium]
MTEARPQTVYRSLLGGDPRIGWLGSGLALAVALHVTVVAAAFFLPRFFDRPRPLRKPVIAHLVALGKPRDPRLMPRKESEPPPGGSPSTPRPSSSGKTAPEPTRQELMERALAGAERRTKNEKPDPERAGQETGSPSGTAASAEEGEKYFGEVEDRIHANYVVPSVISERERLYLSATVVIYIGRDGTIVKHVMTKPSGNSFIDQALVLTLQRTRLPPPPPELAGLVRNEGLEINFKP